MPWAIRTSHAARGKNANEIIGTFIFSAALLMDVCATAFLLAVALGGARTSFAPDAPGDYPYQAVATVGMVGDIVERVAGDKGDVSVIMGTKPLLHSTQGFPGPERFAS